MAWVLLIASAALEAVWATALDASRGFSEPLPSAVFVLAFLASMLGLERAARRIPIGTAYAVWAGLGAALTVSWALVSGAQAFSWWTLLCLAGIVGAVVGLKLVGSHDARVPPTDQEGETTTSTYASSSPPTTATASSQ